MTQQRLLFDLPSIMHVPEKPGIYIIYDLAGIIYVGKSGINIRRRLKSHWSRRGNQNIAMAMKIGAGSSLTFKFWELTGFQANQAEGILIRELGAINYANLRKEKITDDPQGWECAINIAKDAKRLPR